MTGVPGAGLIRHALSLAGRVAERALPVFPAPASGSSRPMPAPRTVPPRGERWTHIPHPDRVDTACGFTAYLRNSEGAVQ